jgi:8-hydroxy-5-deazaflavin:NADPH oxidoreductase
MNITIIGTGNVGKALAGSFERAGYDVTLADRDAETARAAAEQVGSRAAEGVEQAVAGADVVVLAVPYAALDEVAAELAGKTDGKVVVDVTNPLTPDYAGLALEGTSAAEQLQARLPRARVVKAFNTVFAARQAQPTLDGETADGLLASDDDDAKRTVAEIERRIGLRPVDAGALRMARSLEHLAFLNIQMQLRSSDASWQTAWKLLEAPTV